VLRSIDHVQLAMPPGEEDRARAFYVDVLGLTEMSKPPNLAARGGCWFEAPGVKVHMGVEQDFRAARKAHVAFQVDTVRTLAEAARQAGYEVIDDEPLEGFDRVYIYDGFGNRLEMMEPR
jgi:catechol 2,3-dioxygenase-like lactoylglutathione lyase family enzyme